MKKYPNIFYPIILFFPIMAFAYTQEECITCHKEESKYSVLQIPIKEFVSSIHGNAIACGDCHKGVKDKKHQTAKGSGAVNCSQCHSQENRHGLNAKAEVRPACTSCHGLHEILGKNDKSSTIHPDQLASTCKACHPAEAGDVNYISWFSSVRIKSHKKQDFSQNYKKDNCIGCHQGMASHGGKEPVTKENCYVCHTKMQGNSLMGYFHNGPKSSSIAYGGVEDLISAFDLAIIIVALAIMFAGLFRLRSAWRAGLKEKRAGDLTGLLKYLFGHGRILKRRTAGISHLVVFWGFVIPLIVIILSQFGFKIPRIPAGILSFLMDVAGLLFLAGTVFFIIRRLISGDPLGPKRIILPMILLCIILATGFLAEGSRLSIISESSKWASPVGWLLSIGLPSSPVFMQMMIRLHFFAVCIFIAILPFTFFRHLVTGTLNVYYKRKNSRGELKKADIRKGETGANTVNDFTWKQLIDSEACVSCGRCDENCPAAISGKPLAPRKIIQDIRQLMLSGLKDAKKSLPVGLLESKITGDEIWSCTACMACVEHCPVFIEPMDRIIEMRRFQVMGKGSLPAEAVPMLRNIELYGDVQGKGISRRNDWAMNLGVPYHDKEPDVLLWLGCSAAFHPRYQEVARSFVRILSAAGVRFGVLGKDELCCGDPARRLGEESLYLEIAGKNIQSLKNYNIKKIVTLCPHCYNTLKNEYPGLDDSENSVIKDIIVVHATEFVMDLMKEKRIIPKYPVKKIVAYQDPCYLGRVNGIYEQPREIIKSLPADSLKELNRNRENAFCCGGGGGGMWLHEHLGKRLNLIRAEETVESGADIIGTACPYCLTMLDDGISGLDLSKPPKVLDVIEILAASIE